MKKFVILTFSLLCLPLVVMAQHSIEANKGSLAHDNYPTSTKPKIAQQDVDSPVVDFAADVVAPRFDKRYGNPDVSYVPVEGDVADTAADSLHLPALNAYGQMPCVGLYPLNWFGTYDWQLHRGLNVNIGASVFASFGKNVYPGAGFTQNISAMYAAPLSSKVSLAVGGYMNRMSWGGSNYCDAGVNAVLGYKFNDQWEGYIYGQKSIVNKRMPLPLYNMSNCGDRIGAMVKYNVNPNFSIQVSVEETRR